MSERVWTAALLIIGDEILSGRTQDRNLATLAKWLNAAGIRLREVRVVPDDMAAIGEAATRAAGKPRLRVHHRRHRADA